MRQLVAAAIVILTLISLRTCLVVPVRCLMAVKDVENRTTLALESPQYRSLLIARQNIRALQPCESVHPLDVNVFMLEGANYEMMQNLPKAMAAHEKALRIDRRPEIYFNLGLVQLQMSQRDEAISSFVSAVAFAPAMLSEISDDAVRSEVEERIARELGSNWLRSGDRW